MPSETERITHKIMDRWETRIRVIEPYPHAEALREVPSTRKALRTLLGLAIGALGALLVAWGVVWAVSL